jgi:hypothetical protein
MSKKEKRKIDTAKQHTIHYFDKKKSKTTGRNYFWHRAEIILAKSNFLTIKLQELHLRKFSSPFSMEECLWSGI